MTRRGGGDPRRYYHGGTRGLQRGDVLLPIDETGEKPLRDYFEIGVDPDAVRTDRVYLTTDVDTAAFFAATRPHGGTVYEVRPERPVEPDPDYTGARMRSFQVPRATIVAVVGDVPAMSMEQLVRSSGLLEEEAP